METNNEKPGEKKSAGGYHTRKIKRNKKTGVLEEAEVSITAQEIYASDNSRKIAAKTGDGSFTGSAAPRTGGVKIQKTGMATGGSKGQVKSSKRKIKRSSMSSKQKKSALKALGN